MIVDERLQGEAQIHTCLLQPLQGQVLLPHLLHLRFQVVGRDALRQTDITLIAIIAHPVVAAIPHNLGNRRHCHHHLHPMKFGVEGNVLIDAANGEFPSTALVVIDLLPYDITTQFLGQ